MVTAGFQMARIATGEDWKRTPLLSKSHGDTWETRTSRDRGANDCRGFAMSYVYDLMVFKLALTWLLLEIVLVVILRYH